jgi:predicted CXXCH cytochrome family protein
MTRPTSPSLLRRPASPRARLATVLSLLLFAFAAAAGTPYETSKHGDPVTGVQRIPEEGPGACAQCHDEHASRNGVATGGPFDRLLFTVDDETLCYECHSAESSNRAYPGNVVWADSTHSTSSDAWWRGPVPPARDSTDAGKCVNCHDPHATEDALGAIPSMLRLREETLCTGCHDGGAAKDVKAQFAKTYRHPTERTRRHAASEGVSPDPAQYDDSGAELRRHAECDDCHNPHVTREDVATPLAPFASQKLFGIARISVTNGAAGTRPVYQWKGADDLIDPLEYEVCFKCHSGWTTLPPGRPDLAMLTNPNNPSYHPIQGRGRNANIDSSAFESGWAWDSLTYCSDCHGSDDPLVRGPHGSMNRFILLRPSPFTSASQPMSPGDLCFSCHRYEVYGDPLAGPSTQRASRFNRPRERGHAYHVGEQSIPCFACHETHGSKTLPGLMATGRSPGITSYVQSAGGGTCTPTCHTSRSYSVNYAR